MPLQGPPGSAQSFRIVQKHILADFFCRLQILRLAVRVSQNQIFAATVNLSESLFLYHLYSSLFPYQGDIFMRPSWTGFPFCLLP